MTCTENCKNWWMCVKVTASQTWDIFWDTVYCVDRKTDARTDRQTDIFRQRSPHYNARRCVKSGTHWRQSRLLPKPATNRQQCRLLPIRSTLSPVCTGPKRHSRVCRLSRKSTVLNSTLSPVCTGLKGAFTRTLHEWFHWNASSCWLSHRTDRNATAVYGNGRIRIFFNGQATANRFDRYCPLQTTLH